MNECILRVERVDVGLGVSAVQPSIEPTTGENPLLPFCSASNASMAGGKDSPHVTGSFFRVADTIASSSSERAGSRVREGSTFIVTSCRQ